MKVFYYDTFTFPLPLGHRFPAAKYPLLRQRLLEMGILTPQELHIPAAATEGQLTLVHDPDYIRRVLSGRLDEREVRRLGLPWSPELVQRALYSVGATIAASRAALEDGIAASLGGGTHHAYPDHGQGYCIFNDVAVATRCMQQEKRARRVLIVDCDVHQGNGTAAIFEGDETAFTFSIHGEKNFPFHKEKSDLDIALPDGAQDETYLKALREGLECALQAAPFDLAYYLAGADPYAGDRLGRMCVSKAGLAQRDRFVLQSLHEAGIPLVITLSGGYARNIEDIVEIHAETIRIARQIYFGGAE